jgi:hypothetical protein
VGWTLTRSFLIVKQQSRWNTGSFCLPSVPPLAKNTFPHKILTHDDRKKICEYHENNPKKKFIFRSYKLVKVGFGPWRRIVKSTVSGIEHKFQGRKFDFIVVALDAPN